MPINDIARPQPQSVYRDEVLLVARVASQAGLSESVACADASPTRLWLGALPGTQAERPALNGYIEVFAPTRSDMTGRSYADRSAGSWLDIAKDNAAHVAGEEKHLLDVKAQNGVRRNSYIGEGRFDRSVYAL